MVIIDSSAQLFQLGQTLINSRKRGKGDANVDTGTTGTSANDGMERLDSSAQYVLALSRFPLEIEWFFAKLCFVNDSCDSGRFKECSADFP